MRNLMNDMAAGLIFFAVLLITNDIYKATAAGILLGVGQAAWNWFKGRRIELMQGLSLGLVVVMGSATILLHDPRFVMLKATLYFTCAGVAMLKPGWMYRYVPQPKTARPEAAARTIRRFVEVAGRVYAVVTLAMAVLNALIATYASQKAWALFNGVGPAIVYSILGTLLMLGSKRALRNAGVAP